MKHKPIVDWMREKSKVSLGTKKLYVINLRGTNYFKVGVTSNMRMRMESFQTASPFDLDVYFYEETFYSAEFVEEYIHYLLRNYNAKREWFEIPDLLIDNVIGLISEVSSGIKRKEMIDFAKSIKTVSKKNDAYFLNMEVA